MPRQIRILATVLTGAVLITAAPALVSAQTTSSADSATIVAVANRFIAAMASQDTAYMRAASLPSARWVAMPVPTPDGATPRIRGLDQAIADIASRTARWSGWLIDPVVVVTGPIAVLHAPFGAVSEGSAPYCGMDHYVFVQSGGRWLVSDLFYTIQTVGCAPVKNDTALGGDAREHREEGHQAGPDGDRTARFSSAPTPDTPTSRTGHAPPACPAGAAA